MADKNVTVNEKATGTIPKDLFVKKIHLLSYTAVKRQAHPVKFFTVFFISITKTLKFRGFSLYCNLYDAHCTELFNAVSSFYRSSAAPRTSKPKYSPTTSRPNCANLNGSYNCKGFNSKGLLSLAKVAKECSWF